MRIFVVNLPHRTDKRAEILAQGEKYNLPLEIFDAVNGNAIPDEEIKKIVYDYPACYMTKGVIGCSLSHLKIYKKMCDENIDLALVLEDDALLTDDLPLILGELEKIDKNEVPKIYFVSSQYYKQSSGQKIAGGYAIRDYIDGGNSHAYVVNRKAAESLHANLWPIKWEADKWYYFQEMGLVSFSCVVPHVVGVDGVPEKSDLYTERALTNRKRRHYLNGLKHVVRRRRRLVKILWKIFRKPFVKKS
ncbi:glycosyl transferase family 25 [Ereboglobus sp. PH5-5]|uniref:glycosyltransferase family 25 protein n=1 Tax=unclassified Ereboglobus TaxID=2626932 RepID=UPI00240503A1|nr:MULTISPECIES: glycosyltransferase family 25 protein [unclassified Ereboglobus]MDF9827085.1 glycosyl transferase family 25 [Ereboglobus sp. PH5-10]MDF9832500.1 glycosyl transferase family 25 [Ereboglobus sp. PH5-5]